jgi:hypothetical protein
VKWLKLLNRFHLFAANWKLNAFDIEKDAYTKVGFQTNASFTLDDLENCANATKYKISPTTSVTVLVHGNGFWGTMPAKDRIDWDKIPTESDKQLPDLVTSFTKEIVGMSHIMGDHTDLGRIYDLSKWENNPVDKSWFPYIIRGVREANSKLISFYYSPKGECVYLLFEDDEDAMVVKFSSSSAAPAADPRFDLDDGFLSDVPDDMSQACMHWVEDTSRDPDKPLLSLLAPYDVMWKVQDQVHDPVKEETETRKRKERGEDDDGGEVEAAFEESPAKKPKLDA